MTSTRLLGFAAVMSVLTFAAAPAPAAVDCPSGWTQPFVCKLEVQVGRTSETPRPVRANEPVSLTAADTFDLFARAVDQNGRPFPETRLDVRIEPERACQGLVSVAMVSAGRAKLTAGTRSGSCEVAVWTPNNMNLGSTIRFQVAARAATGYSKSEAEAIADRLYLGILGRKADPGGLASTAAAIEQGRLREQVTALVRSQEFIGKRATLPPATLLDSFFQGLLGRAPDPGAVNSYLPWVERRRHMDVVMELIDSPEFETKVRRGLTPK